MVAKTILNYKPDELSKDLAFLMSEKGQSFLEEIEMRLIDTDETPYYLEEFDSEPQDLDSDQLANWKSLKEVLSQCTIVLEAYEDNSKLYGYWNGPENTPLKQAAIITYDSEGTLELESGSSLLEVLIGKVSYNDDDDRAQSKARFAEWTSKVKDSGVKMTGTFWNDLPEMNPPTDPEELRNELYKKYRK